MLYAIYSILALVTCILGTITGMGSGVMLKPLMDLLGHFDAQSISLLSSSTVFTMSVVSLIKSRGDSGLDKHPWASSSRLVVLAIGGIIGGFIGQACFDFAVEFIPSNNIIVIIQNAILLVITLVIFFFLLFVARIRTYKFTSFFVYAITGLLLGLVSAFLGIGGGPINVAVMMFMFSFDMKTSVFSSILIIFFSQAAKLIDVFLSTGFNGFDLSVAPAIIITSIIGGFIGTAIKKKCTNESISVLFNGIQIFIMIICAVNIVKSCF